MGLAVGLVPTISRVMNNELHYREGLKEIVYHYTPYDPWGNKFDFRGMYKGLVPLLGGVLVHKFVGQRMGINRMLKNAGVPLIGI